MPQNGTKNLIPFNQRTEDEVKRIASKGGINSGKARKRKKTQREALEFLLSLKVKNPKDRERLKELGVKVSEMDNQMLALAGVWQKAVMGDVRAAEFLRDTLGEGPNNVNTQLAINQEMNNTHLATLQALQSRQIEEIEEIEEDDIE